VRTPEGKAAAQRREILDRRRVSPFGVRLMRFYARYFPGLGMADYFSINFAAGGAAGCILIWLLLAAWFVMN
jgi:hypothetical protein